MKEFYLFFSVFSNNQQHFFSFLFVICVPRCGGEGSQLYGGAAGGRDLRSVEFGCRHGNHGRARGMTGIPRRAVNNKYAFILMRTQSGRGVGGWGLKSPAWLKTGNEYLREGEGKTKTDKWEKIITLVEERNATS